MRDGLAWGLCRTAFGYQLNGGDFSCRRDRYLFGEAPRHRETGSWVPMLRALSCVSALAITLPLTDPGFAGPPFRTDDPEPVEFQHFNMYLFSLGTRTDAGWTGNLPGLEIDYGALPNLQLAAFIPQGYAAPEGNRTSFALYDIELGAKYRFITPSEDDWFPQVAVYPQVLVPAGNQKFGFSTGHLQIFLPIWLQKDYGPWTAYGGGGYWINPGAGNKNYSFFGTALWYKVNDRLNLGVEIFHQTPSSSPSAGTAQTSPSSPSSSVSTGTKASTGFNVGVIYDVSEHWHLLGAAGTGVQNRAQTNQFSYYVAVLLTF
jgi:hypothetical protein